MTIALNDALLRAAQPVYRCVHCYMRREDHMALNLTCRTAPVNYFEAIPYLSHPAPAAPAP